MTCRACGYGDGQNETQEFIEVVGLEDGPFYVAGNIEGITKRKGIPVKAFACPSCGTVRIDRTLNRSTT
jgi:hypothetical protein